MQIVFEHGSKKNNKQKGVKLLLDTQLYLGLKTKGHRREGNQNIAVYEKTE